MKIINNDERSFVIKIMIILSKYSLVDYIGNIKSINQSSFINLNIIDKKFVFPILLFNNY